MNRFGKRFIGIRQTQNGTCRTASDSASQSFVTVRQIFSDEPTERNGHFLSISAVPPFRSDGCPPCQSLLMSPAPLSSDSILSVYYHGETELSTAFRNFPLFCESCREKGKAPSKTVCIFQCAITRSHWEIPRRFPAAYTPAPMPKPMTAGTIHPSPRL